MKRSTALLVGGLALVAAVAGCGGRTTREAASAPSATVRAATPPAPVPAPAAKPVLTLTGAVTTTTTAARSCSTCAP
ncbi:MAG TPA: hypothetical protein VG276_24005 [Actinomycetes bacterium]|jgi:hypothetical protein|nr:hypothetical protein [Actinomycetes bacterium]